MPSVINTKNPESESNGPSIQELWQVLDLLPFRVFWKDEELRYVGGNRLFCEDADMETADELLGATDFDLPWTDAEAKFYRACDKETMRTGESQIGIVESQTNAMGELTWLETHKIPIRNSRGEATGILGLYRDITETKQAEVELKESHDALEQTNDELESLVLARTRELQHLAQRDNLTNLANRSHFIEQLHEVIGSQCPYAVLFVDLDAFKAVNDSYGHRVGDRLLIRVAKAMEEATFSNAVIGRFGGDEFTILLRSVRNIEEVLATSERLLGLLKNPVEVDGITLSVGASIGVLVDLENEYESSDEVVRDADLAMYEAKKHGKSQYCVFEMEMLGEARRRSDRERQIGIGIAQHQFVPAFQPICRPNDHRVVAFEILASLKHPDGRFLCTSEFVRVAEEMGRMQELGISVIGQALDQLEMWRIQSPLTHSLNLSVNLSPIQVTQELPKKLETMMAKRKLSPECIDLEVTETLLQGSDESIEALGRLREIGFGLVLDGFGTGFSSLSYLHQLPLDQLKIGRTFVSSMAENPNSQQIVNTIIGLSHKLGLSVVAEGVETQEQLDMLRQQDCDYVQGYFLGRPMIDDDLDGFMRGAGFQTGSCGAADCTDASTA